MNGNVLISKLGSLVTFMTLLLLFLSPVKAQTFSSVTDGSTPSALKPGAPAGSYGLSGFENVNLYNGNLNFALPLVHLGGRGNVDFTMMLTIEQHWRIRKPKPAPGCELTGTCDLRFPWPGWWTAMNTDYGPGGLQGRKPGVQCGDPSLTRLTFIAPGGTEFELRDQLNNGQPLPFTCGASQGASRGTTFVTSDGSAATFVSDTTIFDTTSQNSTTFTPSGYLMLKDGTRYRIDAGKVSWMRDRNGNKLTFTYIGAKVSSITDSLNRQINISYSVADVAPYGTCDQITFKGFGGAQRTIRVSKTSLANALRTTQFGDSSTTWTFKQLFPDLDGSATSQHNPTVISSLWLPDGQRRYKFYYNVYSELARVELPTGGAIEYDFGNATNPYDGIYRRVTERRVYADGANLEGKITYSDGLGAPVTVDSRDATGTLLARSKHYFYGNPSGSLDQFPWEYSEWRESREYKTEEFASNGTTLLRQTTNTWQQRAAVGWWTGNPDLAPSNDPRVSESTFTLVDTNQVSKKTFSYDDSVPFNNRSDLCEYGYGTGAPGSLVRRTHTDYLKVHPVNAFDYTATSIHIRNLPTQQQIFDAAGVEKARTTFEYDNYSNDGLRAPLTPRTGISGMCDGSSQNCPTGPNFTDVSYQTRGNATKTTNWILSPSTQLNSYRQYDVAGNIVKVIDPRGYATTFDFADRFGVPDGDAQSNVAPSELSGQTSFAFMSKVVNALGHTAYAQFDYYLGRAVDAEDANGAVASGYFNDVLDRPTQIRRAVGTGVTNQASFSYDDLNRIITTTSDLNSSNDNLLVSKVIYDGLGRTIESRRYEGGTNYSVTQQQYDGLGREFKTSNPFRPWQSESAVWTTSVFDGLGRVTSVTTDNSVVTNSYNGNQVTVTDQSGKKRKSETDALGRLAHVWEDPNGANYQTSYQYDVLDNLTVVTQGVQTRSFVYDSLSRLTSATNPENGTVSYSYDNNGNMLTRLDARSVTTTMAYDALNRITSKSYNDTPQTPTVNYFYDAQSLPGGAPTFDRGYATGRLVATTYSGSEGTYLGYDRLGRVVRQYQRTDSVNYLVEASYYANGSIHDETYPSVPGAGDRRVVSHTNDDAGRLVSLNSPATSYAPVASVSNIAYASHDGLKSETYGNGLIHAVNYNSRLQPTEVKLGTGGAPTSVIGLTYNYGTTTNNGNILSVSYSGGGLSYTQSFGYDGLNRLTTSQETNGGTSWSQTNGYDRYGNRWIDFGGGSQSLYFNAGSNRITGSSYDGAGNLLNDGSHAYTFNGENMIRTVDSQSAYVYNGEGLRVRKLLGENNRFIYGIGGALIAEFDGASGALKKEYIYGPSGLLATIEPTALNANGTRYLTADHLGSPRVLTNSSATVVSRHDYMPFGEELGAGTGGRTVGMGFSVADGARQKFTSHERDSETGLDFAKARFYSSGQGRFTSVDPLTASAVTANPQTFNRYSYVLNSPLTLIDPTGMLSIDPGGRGSGIPLVSLANQDPQQPAGGGPPPPGGPVSVGPIKIDIGPAPLPEGQEPWPTTLEVVQGNNRSYNGDPVLSPSGEVIDSSPYYGIGRTVDYIIRDQAGNPMSTGVLLKEQVTPTNQQAQDVMGNVAVNKDPQRPDSRGIVPDTLGFISPDRRILSLLQRYQVNATFSQTITVYGTVGKQYRTALLLTNQIQATNSGVTITTGAVEQRSRPK